MNFFEFSYNYLLNQTKDLLTKKQIDDFIYKPEIIKITSLNEVYKMLVVVLQDYQSLPNVINFSKREQEISKILFNYDPYQVSKYSYQDFYNAFKKEFNLSVKNDTKNLWVRFSKGIFEGALFLSKFKSVKQFKKFIKTFSFNSHTRLALPLLLSAEIHGLGFALGCNWLKELGYTEYPKPDTHTKDIFTSLGLCENNDISCYKAMIKLAEECKISPYSLDKVVWLICSGNYYRYDIQDSNSTFVLKTSYIKSLDDWKNGRS